MVIDIIGATASTVSLFAAICFFFYGLGVNKKMTKRIEKVNKNLTDTHREITEKIDTSTNRMEQVEQSLEKITETNKEITQKIEISEELISDGWVNRLNGWIKQATDHDPAYIEIEKRKYCLTVEGKRLLQGDLMNKINNLIDSTKDNVTLLRGLGIQYLFDKAKERNVEIRILLAVIATHADGERIYQRPT